MAPIFLGNNLQLGTYANSAALRTALLQWCYSSRNFGANPNVSAGNGTSADEDNRMQVDSLKKGKGERAKANTKSRNEIARPARPNTSSTDINTCENCGRTGHWAKDCWRPGGGAYDNSTSDNTNTQKGNTHKKGKGKSRHVDAVETNKPSETASTMSYPSQTPSTNGELSCLPPRRSSELGGVSRPSRHCCLPEESVEALATRSAHEPNKLENRLGHSGGAHDLRWELLGLVTVQSYNPATEYVALAPSSCRAAHPPVTNYLAQTLDVTYAAFAPLTDYVQLRVLMISRRLLHQWLLAHLSVWKELLTPFFSLVYQEQIVAGETTQNIVKPVQHAAPTMTGTRVDVNRNGTPDVLQQPQFGCSQVHTDVEYDIEFS